MAATQCLRCFRASVVGNESRLVIVNGGLLQLLQDIFMPVGRGFTRLNPMIKATVRGIPSVSSQGLNHHHE